MASYLSRGCHASHRDPEPGLQRAYNGHHQCGFGRKVDEKLKEAQPQVEMKGFRKGKVPMAMLKSSSTSHGRSDVKSIDGAVNNHLEETGTRPAMQPAIKMTNED